MLADDPRLTRTFYHELFAAQGCLVTLARTGEEAVAQVREPGLMRRRSLDPGTDPANRHVTVLADQQ